MQARGGYVSAPVLAVNGAGGTLFTINKAGPNTLTDVFDNPLGGTGTTALTLNASGTTTFTGNNTYTGATTITAGTLTASAASGQQALGGTSRVTINTGGTLLLGNSNQVNDTAAMTLAGGTFNAGGFSETLGALTLSSTSIIDFGNLGGGSTLRFADSSAIAWTGTLRVYNYTNAAGAGGDHLYFGTNPNAGLTAAQLGQISFFSDAGATPLSRAGFGPLNGEVSPVPEPSSVAIGVGLVGMIGWRERRRVSVLFGRP